MRDFNGNEITSNMVVEIKDAYSAQDNGLWLVERIYDDSSLWLVKLNKDLSKSKSKYNVRSWPLKSYMNDCIKRYEINQYNQNHAKLFALFPYIEPAQKSKKVSNEVKILKKGIRKGEDYCPCCYWLNRDYSITIISKHYNTHIPREVGDVRNDSDSMTDYFEKDSCVLHPGDKYYDKVLSQLS